MKQTVDTHDYIATTLRNLYVAKMTQNRNGRPYKFPSRSQGLELWRKAATLCLDMEADPEQFIEAAFTYCAISCGPMPNMLSGNAARGWWANWKRTHRVDKTEVMHVLTGEPVMVEIGAYKSLLSALNLARDLTENFKGTRELGSLACLETMRSPASSELLPHVKLLLFPHDPELLSKYGAEAYRTLQSSEMANAASALGFDVEKTKQSILSER